MMLERKRVLVTGGARSGKSHYAEKLAAHSARGERVLYLATLEALDDEMVRRIETHQKRRPEAWRTLTTPLAPAAALREASEKVVLLDCLSGFVSNLVLQHEAESEEVTLQRVTEAVKELLSVAKRSSKVVVVVTNEVGSGVVPPYPLGRLFRDALGAANARVAAAADGRNWRQSAVRVPAGEIRSSNGAGDAFAAGVMLGLHEGMPVERCLVQGVCVAAVSLLSLSPSAGVLPLAECLARGERWGFGPV